MNTQYRLLIVFTFIAIVIAGFLFLKTSEEAINKEPPTRNYAAMEIIQNPQPFCIGRILVDLPPALHPAHINSEVKLTGSANFNGTDIETETGVSLEEFKARVAARWEEVKTYTHPLYSEEPYAKPSEYIKVKENGIVMAFNYGEVDSNARWENGKAVTDIVIVNDAEGYYWEQETMFTLKDGSYDWVNDDLKKIILNLRYSVLGEIPEQPGICLIGGFMEGFYQDTSESQFFSFEGNKNFSWLLLFDPLPRAKEASFLEQRREGGFAKKGKKLVNVKDTLYTLNIHRANERENDLLPSSEYVISRTKAFVTSDDIPTYDNDILAYWEFLGEAPHAKPYIRFDMVVRNQTLVEPKEPGGYPVPNRDEKFPTEEEFFALWDSIVSSIRFRPNALIPAPVAPPKEAARLPSEGQRSSDRRALDDFLGEG